MRKLPLLLLLAASCGSKSKPAVTPPSNEGTGEESATYGGEEWGQYGEVGYGGFGYGRADYGVGGQGYGDGGDGYYQPPPPQPPKIVGTWVSACTPGAHGSGKSDFHTMTFVNTDARWDLVIALFGDDKCAKRKSAIHLAGSYTFGAQSAAVATAWEGNFTVDAKDLTADDAKTAKALGKLCGIKKMKAGTVVDIHEKGCAKLGFKPAADCASDYDLVALDGDVLRFGVRPADNDMCSPEKRPTTLDTASDSTYQYPSTGVPECDAVVEGYRGYMRCPALPAEARTSVFDAIRDSLPSLGQMGAAACQQASDAMKQALAAMSC